MGHDEPNKAQVKRDTGRILQTFFDILFLFFLFQQDTLLPILCADPPSNIVVNTHLDQNRIVPFIIAMFHRINPSQNYPQALLCIAPASQMAKEIIEIGSKSAKFSSIKLGYIDNGKERENEV